MNTDPNLSTVDSRRSALYARLVGLVLSWPDDPQTETAISDETLAGDSLMAAGTPAPKGADA